MTGFQVVEWEFLDHAGKDTVHVGDVICADAGGMPAYQVVAIQDGRAWLRDEEHPFDWVLPLGGFQWKARRGA